MIRKERTTVLKKDNRWLQNRTNRLVAYLLVRFLRKTSVRPNHLTLFSLILSIFSALLIVPDIRKLRILASVFLFCSLIFDSADGQLARLKNETSKFGYWFDKVADRLKESLLMFAIAYVMYRRSLKIEIWCLGIGAIFLINFMYYNLELLKKTFCLRETGFPQNNLIIRNLLSFGYGERIIYFSILLLFNQLVFILWLVIIGCTFHILVNTYTAIKKREA